MANNKRTGFLLKALKSIIDAGLEEEEPQWKKLGFLDEEEYEDWCAEQDEDEEEDEELMQLNSRASRIPVGCRACGGDYPNCTSSCPMFDD